VKPVIQLDDSVAANQAEKLAFRNTLWLCLDIGLRCGPPPLEPALIVWCRQGTTSLWFFTDEVWLSLRMDALTATT
jgi:hypothetical protein